MALKSQAISNDWDSVCRTLERTLNSVCGQTDPDFRVFVACHEIPKLSGKVDSRVEFLKVDFPTPDLSVNKSRQVDKYKKLSVGLARAKFFNPQFLMIMDADDLVSRHLVEHAHAHPNSHGWFINKGYVYHSGSRLISRTNALHTICGTSAIINARLVELPDDPVRDMDKCILLKYGHTAIWGKLTEQGTPLEPLPFSGTIYILSHGENITPHISKRPVAEKPTTLPGRIRRALGDTRRFLRTLSLYRLITPTLCKEFSIAKWNL